MTPPLSRPATPIVIERRVACGRYVPVARVLARHDGNFRATIAAPRYQQAAVYIARTLVPTRPGSRKLFTSVSLARIVGPS